MYRRDVLDHGYVTLRNVSGPTRRPDEEFDADDVDPANCARISFDGNDKERPREADLKLAKYLIAHKHTTPIEMIELWFEMKMPIFVARQFIRHRTATINEISGRYVKLPNEFYIPDPANVGIPAPSNKQGRLLEPHPGAHEFCQSLKKTCDDAYAAYEFDLANKIPNEIARARLPLNLYTKWLWKQDLHNIMHMIALRIDNHAQWEAQQYAQAVYELIKQVLPHSMAMFDQYRRMNIDQEKLLKETTHTPTQRTQGS